MQFFLVTCDVPANARQQVRERHPDGCYHRALHLLGGYPIWRSEDILLQFWAVSEDLLPGGLEQCFQCDHDHRSGDEGCHIPQDVRNNSADIGHSI
jgi:hypothetical protein